MKADFFQTIMSVSNHLIKQFKNIHFSILLLLFMTLMVFAHPLSYNSIFNNAPANDSVPSTTKIDSLNLKSRLSDSTLTDSTKNQKKKDKIDAEIKYTTSDSIVFTGNGTAYLHGQGDVTYKNINLKADFMRIKLDSSTIFAKGTADSLGKKIGEPEFSEGDKKYNSKELTYNFKSKKGFIRQAVTQEGEGYIISDKTKKTEKEEFCMTHGKFTTCDNHDHPDFYLSMSRGKVKPGKYVVTGPAHLVLADVPLPIAIPFGFFPFTDDYSSGLLMPSYADEMTRGFGLTNGGYYFAFNDYVDLELRGDIYTKGTWAIRGNSTYRKRYKYSGNVGIEYREDITGEKGLSNYVNAQSFRVVWSHSQDAKANPNFTFSSSVNFSTSGYNTNNINYYSKPEINSQNTTMSTISFQKRFPDLPSLSLSGNMSVTQRQKDSTISISFPNINVSYSNFYPFKRKKAVGSTRWYEKISASYRGAIANSITTKENQLMNSSLSSDWKNGMQHNVSVSTSFNLLKYINISPSVSYNERWYLQRYNREWDVANQKVIADTIRKFSRVYDYNMSVSASTKFYGYFEPIKSFFGDKIERIRHVITPQVSFSYHPDFGASKYGFWDSYTKSVADTNGVYYDTDVYYSRYEGALYGSPGRGKSGSVGFSLSNNLEMKVKNSKDTVGDNPTKIISLIDNFTVSGSYNMAADSMNWSTFAASLRLKLTKTYTLSLSTSFDPYMYALNSSGNPVKVNELRWNHGKFPKFMGTSSNLSMNLNNETLKKLFGKKPEGNKEQTDSKPEGGLDAQNNNQNENNPEKKEDKPASAERDIDGYVKTNIPWNIGINYTISYGNTSEFNKQKMEYNMAFRHSLSFNGSIELTKNWRFSTSTTYNFENKQFTSAAINITRSLHCWSMSGSVVPFGVYKSYNFHIGVNASMLSDLKWDKNSGYTRNAITWY